MSEILGHGDKDNGPSRAAIKSLGVDPVVVRNVMKSLTAGTGLVDEGDQALTEDSIRINVCDQLLDKVMATGHGHIVEPLSTIQQRIEQVADAAQKSRLLARLDEAEMVVFQVRCGGHVVQVASESSGKLSESFKDALKEYLTPYMFHNIMQAEAGLLRNQRALLVGTERAYDAIVANIDTIGKTVHRTESELADTASWITYKINLFPNGAKKAILLSQFIVALQKAKEKIATRSNQTMPSVEITERIRRDIAEQLYLDTIESRGVLNVAIVSALRTLLSEKDLSDFLQKYVAMASTYQDILTGNEHALDLCEKNIDDLNGNHRDNNEYPEWVIQKINLLPESPAKKRLLLKFLRRPS